MYLYPLHSPTDTKKVLALAESLAFEGWKGRPLLVDDEDHPTSAYTGSHRIAALLHLDHNWEEYEERGATHPPEDIEVPVVAINWELLKQHGFIDDWNEAARDEDRLELLEEVGDLKAVAVMEEEMKEVNASVKFIAPEGEATPRLALVPKSISHLKSYLTMSDSEKGRELARLYMGTFVHFLEDWWIKETADSMPDELLESLEDYDESVLDDISDEAFEEFLMQTHSVGISGDPASPTFLHMDYQGIVRNQWLIHFTDDAWGIHAKGFQRGVWNLAQLGLTTHVPESEKESGGYNFSYLLSDFAQYGKERFRGWKYGKEAVLFRASGLVVYHHGDQEPQVIFEGKSARDIVPISETNEGYGVHSCRTDDLLFEADLEDVVGWVVSNYSQYRKHLVCK